VIHRIEELLKINVYDIAVSFANIFQYITNGLMGWAIRSECKTTYGYPPPCHHCPSLKSFLTLRVKEKIHLPGSPTLYPMSLKARGVN
jgi:hypothetical protein